MIIKTLIVCLVLAALLGAIFTAGYNEDKTFGL